MTITQPTLTPTSGAVWRQPREQGYTVTLPSGNVATLRPVALDSLLAAGEIPDLLSPVVAKTLWAETEPAALAEQGELAKGFLELIALVVPLAMMEPIVVNEPRADNEIALDDIELADKVGIFNLATGGASVLKSFLAEETKRLDAISDRENLRPETE